ncbi:Hypothetical protein NCS54_01499000 [Fusarium falciforme]|uniref:Hypothetical protein n=1 Tax=Fusarium falciforme TaxID=195108 RepID=UPI00230003AB|nr:Hypothetical protein NCS54_01499000 [Fusarium falciforme]WAO97271.1 Hypothetical protein NCS54_01499000 [Fusarium falciforme]
MPTKAPEATSLMVQDEGAEESQPRRGTATRPFRQPFWLSKVALFLFFLTFIACIIALVVLDRVVTSRNGLPLTISTSSYSWTYGPTAILIVILSLWRRVDYNFKAIQPWCELFTGPSPSSRSILLDYITPFQAVSITKALKHRHYPVASTIAAFFLLKLVILISTTLFVMRETSLRGTFSITYQDSLNATDLWALYSQADMDSLAGKPYLHPDFTPVFSGGSAAPIWTYLGSLNNVTSNETQWLLPDDQVTQRFSLLSSRATVRKLHAPVDVFFPDITCEDAVVLAPKSARYHTVQEYREYKFVSESCNNSGVILNVCRGSKYGDLPLPPDESCQPEPRAYTVHRVNCSGVNDTLNLWNYNEIPMDSWATYIEGYDIRYAITATQFKPTWDNTELAAIDLVRSGCIICKVGYGIGTSEATLDLMTGSVALSPTGRNITTLRNLSSNAFAELLWKTLERPADFLVVGDNVPTLKAAADPKFGPVPGAEAVLFQLMYAQLGRPTDLGIFYERPNLKNASISVLEGVAREFARQSLLVPKLRRADAQGMKIENRLHMRRLAVWIMAGGFCALAIICLLLLWSAHPVTRIPSISASIAGHAAILANSPNAQAALTGAGHLSECELKRSLARLQFSAVTDRAGRLQLRAETASAPSNPLPCPPPKARLKKHRWLPLAVRLPVIGITYTAPILLIGTLEFLHRLLRDKDHLLVVGTKDSVASSYVIRLVSTLVVFGLATMINNLDFTIVTFAPYSSLRFGSVSAERSILFNPLSVNPFLVLFKTIQHGQLGAAASNAATLIAGFLTIIVSGLWVPMDSRVVNQPSSASVENWDLRWLANPADDGGAGIRLNLIRNSGAVTPTTIWNDLVVPQISFPPNGTYGSHRKVSSTFDVLALQPVLNCTVLPQEAISAPPLGYKEQAGKMGHFVWVSRRMILVNPPRIEPECSFTSNNSFADLKFSRTYETESGIWVGQYIDLTNSTAGQVSNVCPSIGMFFGQIRDVNVTGLTGLVCTQGINEVPVTINYRGDPALGEINSLRVRGQSQALKNKTSGSHTLGYKLKGFMDSTLLNFARNDPEYQYDPFFNQLVKRPNGYSREDLLGPNNADKLVKAVTQDYCEYMRHIIDRNFRASNSSRTSFLSATDGNSATSSRTIITGSYSAEVTHLVIDSTSKRILQILLAIMTGLSLLGFVLVKIRGTLPRDPCSIGSTMALLADSQLCDRESGVMPQNAEHMSERQLKQVFDGWVFSLGWWHRDAHCGSTAPEEVYSSGSSGNLASDTECETRKNEKLFGIDIGRANSWGWRFGGLKHPGVERRYR